MPKVPLPDMLADAEKSGYAIGYFEAWDLYSLEAVVSAAEAENSPVIIGIGGLSANHEWLTSAGIDIYGDRASRLRFCSTRQKTLPRRLADSGLDSTR